MHYYLLFLCSPFGSRGWAGSQPQSPSWTTRDCCRHVVTAFLYATHSLFKLFGSKYHLYGQKIYIFKIKKGKKNIKTKGKIKSKSFFHTWQISIYTWLCVSWKHRRLIGRKLWPVLFVNMLRVSERPEFCSAIYTPSFRDASCFQLAVFCLVLTSKPVDMERARAKLRFFSPLAAALQFQLWLQLQECASVSNGHKIQSRSNGGVLISAERWQTLRSSDTNSIWSEGQANGGWALELKNPNWKQEATLEERNLLFQHGFFTFLSEWSVLVEVLAQLCQE